MLINKTFAGWRLRKAPTQVLRIKASLSKLQAIQLRRYAFHPISESLSKDSIEVQEDEGRSITGHTPSRPNPRHQLDLPAIDREWQAIWATQKYIPRTGEETEKHHKAYILPMFPYPSGSLHMGHMRVYTIADVLSRWKHMHGFKVFSPMGWDAFGLPAENAAIERGVEPAAWTKSNIEKMRGLLQQMNTRFDWSKELATCDPAFYKHTQQLFLLMKQHGLAYQAEGEVNWDPIDRTVLANEQVDKDGCSWRSGAKVEKRRLKQWYLKVTEFKQALLNDLDMLGRDGDWPESVLAQQRHWIGRSQGARIKFTVGSTEDRSFVRGVEVFTTRPDTLLGVQFLAVSASHPLVKECLAHDEELQSFVNEMPTMSEDSKAGFRLKNIFAANPAVAITKEPGDLPSQVPIFVAPYVLEEYGKGAVMGVPGHDDRDHAFWKLNSPGEAVRHVVGPANGDIVPDKAGVYKEKGKLLSSCGSWAGLDSKSAGIQFVAQLAEQSLAEEAETWRLRDWLISRQRYWGTPIPIVHCDECGAVPVPDEDLPVELPRLSGEDFKGKMGNPLERAEEWLHTPCPACSKPAKRETDTMDTFVDSSWYFMRFPDARNTEGPFSRESADEKLPVDIYVGGSEHAILHLLYARFVSKFLTSIGHWPLGKQLSVRGEPFHKLITQGMVHGKTYTDPDTGRFLLPAEVDPTSPSEPKMLDGRIPNQSYEKMSKSKYNGVDPTALIQKHGADVVRAHTLFSAPVEDVLDWDDTKIVGVVRWLNKLWRHVQEVREQLLPKGEIPQPHEMPSNQHLSFVSTSPKEQQWWKSVQVLLSSINEAYKTNSLNTLISDLMKLTNEIIGPAGRVDGVNAYKSLSVLLRAMAPVTPAFAEASWRMLHALDDPQRDADYKTNQTWHVLNQPFPRPDKTALKEHTWFCTVQHNGKFKFKVEMPVRPAHIDRNWVIDRLQQSEEAGPWLRAKAGEWKKVMYIKHGAVINYVDVDSSKKAKGAKGAKPV